jgi:hypothetical protein
MSNPIDNLLGWIGSICGLFVLGLLFLIFFGWLIPIIILVVIIYLIIKYRVIQGIFGLFSRIKIKRKKKKNKGNIRAQRRRAKSRQRNKNYKFPKKKPYDQRGYRHTKNR